MEYTYQPEKSSGDYNGTNDHGGVSGHLKTADQMADAFPLSFPQHDTVLPDLVLKINYKTIKKINKEYSEESETDDGDKDRRDIRCRFCGHPITRQAYRIDINGSHHHTFNNPSGYLFEIGCFSSASGCASQGKPTLEFSWFTGYSWCFALCVYCHAHLGWLYQSMSGSRFYGLILNHLTEK